VPEPTVPAPAPTIPEPAPVVPPPPAPALPAPAVPAPTLPTPVAAVTTAATTAASTMPLVTTGLEQNGNLRLMVNKSVTLTTSRPYKRLSIGQPDIADVNGIGPTRILVNGKKAGSTQIIVWDEQDNSQMIDVQVQANMSALRELYARLLPTSKIDIVDNEGTIALTGRVPDLEAADQAQQLASGYATKVLNLLEVSGGQQVMLQVRFAEVSRSVSSQLGVNLGITDGNAIFGSNIGQVSPLSLIDPTANAGGAGHPILGVPSPGPAVTAFGRGVIGMTAFDVFVDALRRNSLLRVLAEPNLVALSGQQGSFLAGGDFPIPIVQNTGGSSGSAAITVENREFGVRLLFTPVVLGGGKIRLKLEPEVSDVDFTNAVLSGGFRIPGRRTRRLSTTVELYEGQTFAVAGLMDNRVDSNKDVTPVLGDLPVIGALFRSVRYTRNDTELVVMVTPRLVSGMNPGEVPALPGEKWLHPSEADLFLNANIGRPVEAVDPKVEENRPPRRFIGNYGYMPATAAAQRGANAAPAGAGAGAAPAE
jgi:pilus assembly protein CpaC